MNTNTSSTIVIGNLTVPVRDRCNRIDACPQPIGYGLHSFFCANCGRDLEVTTGANGFRHTAGREVIRFATGERSNNG